MIEAYWVKPPEWKEKVAAFVSKRIWGDVRSFGPYAAMAVIDDNRLVAGVVAHNYHPDCGVIELSGASDMKLWLTRPVIRLLFNYCFDALECQNVVMRISVDDKPLQRILKSFGFVMHRLPRLRGRSEDEIIAMLFDDVWRAHRVNQDTVTGRP